MKIEIVFLGTGSSIPTAKRNHPGILLQYGNENILIDCGEGIKRQFRVARLNPCNITRILITHWHGDHVLGIPGLLQTLVHNNYNKKLFIYGPKGTKKYMEAIMQMFIFHGRLDINIEEVDGRFLETKDFFFEAEKMKHNTETNAYAFVEKDKLRIKKDFLKRKKIANSPELKNLLEGKDIKIGKATLKAKEATYLQKGKKIVVILDTAMNQNAVEIAKNASLLICESSFSKDEEDKAEEYFHLTTEQAAGIAKESMAEQLVLVHLSQRYEKSENKILAEAKKIFPRTKLAHDFMKLEI